MQTKKVALGLRVALCAAFALAAILSLFAGLFQFDPDANYFLPGSVLPPLSIAAALCGAVFAALLAFLKDAPPVAHRRFAALFPAVASLGAGVVMLRRSLVLFATSRTLSLLSAAFLLFSALYFILSTILKPEKGAGALSFLSFFPILAMALLTFYYYFDKSIEMNSPLKITLQIGLLFAMPLFLIDARRLLGRAQPRLLLALRGAFLPLSALSWVVLAKAPTGRADYLFGALLLLSIQLYALANLFPTRDHI